MRPRSPTSGIVVQRGAARCGTGATGAPSATDECTSSERRYSRGTHAYSRGTPTGTHGVHTRVQRAQHRQASASARAEQKYSRGTLTGTHRVHPRVKQAHVGNGRVHQLRPVRAGRRGQPLRLRQRSTLQRGAACCNTVQHAATRRNVLQRGEACCNAAQHVATRSSMLHCGAACCSAAF